jgi:polyhydroxyalkanoate synthase subunit PhaC
MMIPTPRKISDAAANATHKLRYGRLADLRSMPVEPIDDQPQHTVFRYRPSRTVIPTGPPVLMVPPPVASASSAFDLRRGCSLAEHLVSTGRRTYLLDYGQNTVTDRNFGLAEGIGEVLPQAIRKVSADAGGQPVQLVGWCLGGIYSLLAAAADRELPIASITTIAAPIDFSGLRPAGAPRSSLTGGTEAGLLTLFDGITRPLAGRGYQLLGIDKYVMRPIVVLANLDNADFLAHIEAVDTFTSQLLAYSGRTIGQMYRLFFRKNGLAKGAMTIGGKRVRLADVKVPVLVIAGRADEIAPWKAVHPLTRLLTGSGEVRFETAPGGHLGVLTGRTARNTTWRTLDSWLDAGSVRHGLRAPKPDGQVTASRS